jgi:hypothetical protein
MSKLEYLVLQTGLSSFGHRICPASSPDYSKFFRTYPVICPDMSGISAKNLNWIKIFILWFIPSINLDLCDHMKIFDVL